MSDYLACLVQERSEIYRMKWTERGSTRDTGTHAGSGEARGSSLAEVVPGGGRALPGGATEGPEPRGTGCVWESVTSFYDLLQSGP